jgi:isoaspartyl peptidase/L-asparaginase-like protein (Ntn-hydrolase superfamily)
MKKKHLLLALLALAIAGCDRPSPAPAPAPSAALPPVPWKTAAIAHGGVGGPLEVTDGCRSAVDAALHALEQGADPVDAAVAGVVVMEDDPRFNAGTGANVRLDGATVQMDASVMRSDGRFAAVAGVEAVKNPVKVARAVMDTPHIFLAGDGATRFARSLGMSPWDPITAQARERTASLQKRLLAHDPALGPWATFDWRARWNFERSIDEAGLASGAPSDSAVQNHDTVGVAVRASDGRFGVALSTGGTAITLRGRVGDVPIYGAGLYAGKFGASAATGTGERIVEAGLGRKVHVLDLSHEISPSMPIYPGHQKVAFWPHLTHAECRLRLGPGNAVEELPPQFRLAVLLADVEGFSYKEIAQMTGAKIGTVMSRISRGRKLLQRTLWKFAQERGYLPRGERHG